MDDKWERTIPFLTIDLATVSHLFSRFDPKVKVKHFYPLTEGKRNTNYRVFTSDEEQTYLLRVFPPGEDGWRMETRLRTLLSDRVPMQPLYFLDQDEAIHNRIYAIYKFSEGVTLLEAMISGYVPEDALFHELGSLLAIIHSHPYDRSGFLDEQLAVVQELAPMETWFNMFLNHNARHRLGAQISARIEQIAIEKNDMHREMDSRIALIHGDFRPTNLLIHQGKVSSILDWEFATAGHPIADLGQFFRYEEQFAWRQKEALIQAYQNGTGMLLPDDWENMGRMRDLASLLQMIGVDEDYPDKFEDLKQLIERTLRHLAW
jgi:aminoglycoside phosphotransferase (APT) family kinase protein